MIKRLHSTYVKTVFNGLVNGNRASLARSITLIETTSETRKTEAQELLDMTLQNLKQQPTKSYRIGFTGPPGVSLV